MNKPELRTVPTCTHWGNYRVGARGNELVSVTPYEADPDPTPIGQSLLNALDPNCRIAQPMVREGYLNDPAGHTGSGRGAEAFVPVSWETATTVAADALRRIKEEHGNKAIYGGSYGWSSAGRFHHAQSQLHRFLNQIGGYTASINTYSTSAAEVIMPHVLGLPLMNLLFESPTVEDIARNAKTVVLFGGAAMKNTQVNSGGLGAHTAKQQLSLLRDADVDIVNVSPIRDDVADFLDSEWWPCRPNSDVALMLGLAHTLVSEDLHDTAFLDKYTVGFENFRAYLMGDSDGVPKDAQWSAGKSEIPAEKIRDLARRLANQRSVIGISWSLQRQDYGEQSYWMITTLGAMLGHMGLAGGGVAYGYGCIHNFGFAQRKWPPYSTGALPQGKNSTGSYIPVSRIADMLLGAGETIDYNGRKVTFPDIQLIYWAGGNPFHHHQDLNRLRKAWQKPQTIIVNDSVWTAAARHADIVFPATTSLERNDLGGSSYDCYLSPMRQAVEPFADSRTDYSIFSGLAERLGVGDEFTEGRSEMDWLQHLYARTKENAASANVELPEFEVFWFGEQIALSDQIDEVRFTLERFREDPEQNPIGTPSGKIEIFSENIAGYDYQDCVGHACWYESDREWLGCEQAAQYPLHLVSNQPRTRLHSQFDHGKTSREAKIKDRECLRMHPQDAAQRGLVDGEVVRVFNGRGACLAGLQVTERVRESVVELPTGAWYDPEDPNNAKSLEVHGNPNVLTRDRGTSSLAQGPSAHSCLVQVAKFESELPPVKAFSQPLQSESFD